MLYLRINIFTAFAAILLISACGSSTSEATQPNKPNIVFAIADDAGFPHMGAYGTDWVKTPNFDRVAREGLLFSRAYTPNAKCAPSRATIITGRNSWQLEAAANHWPAFPAQFTSFVEVLGENGYTTGHTGKGWGPGKPGSRNGKVRELTGPRFSDRREETPTNRMSGIDYSANFTDFLQHADSIGQPWFFWYGATEPHRAYEYGTGVRVGNKRLTDIDSVPAYWPDNEVVRNDLLDYALEIEHFDRHLGEIIQQLEARDELDNTIIVVTSDNGMPFPRVKGQTYELNNHLPLAIMYPKGIENSGRAVANFVNFIDFAPTFLEVAQIDWSSSGMAPSPGLSLTRFFKENLNQPTHEYVLVGKERHDVGRPEDAGYPTRGIVKDQLFYVRNYTPEAWPAGNPETGYLNTDGSPTKTEILNLRRSGENTDYWELNFGKRPAEQLFDLRSDPYCLHNVANDPNYQAQKKALAELMIEKLLAQNDPRARGDMDYFKQYEDQSPARNFYERFTNGENVKAGWVNPTDFEKQAVKTD